MVALTESGTSTGSLAYNDVSLLRQTRQAAHIGIDLNGQERHRLQLFRARPGAAAGLAHHRADAAGPVPAATLARGDPQGRYRSALPGSRSLQAPGQRDRRLARDP
ncbi:hypothetical protein G6F61_014953 [Rhizopus arrhizus]|nr:hypothetical protein G6F61_014953 [Rhizopus arrhizus]